MITGLIFDLLPVWLGRLGDYARQSAIYRLLAWLWHWAEGLVRGSLCGRLWQGSARLRDAAEDSLFYRMIDAVIRWATAFVGKLAGWLVRPVTDSASVCAIGKIRGCNFAWFYGLVFLGCYLCPGPLWRNQFGLLLSMLLFCLMLLDAWNHERLPFRASDLGLGFWLFVFASVLGVMVAADRGEALRVFCFYLTALLFCLSLVGIVTNRGRLMAVLGFLWLTLVLTGGYAIVQRIVGVETNASLTDLTVNAGMPGRVYSTLENPNNYAEFILLMFPVSLVYCMNLQDRRWKTLAVASLVIPVAALLMTYSRSSWVGFALAAVVFLALWNRRLLPLLAVAAVLALPILPESVFNRILTIGSTADSSNMYRVYIWSSVLEMLGDFGLTGIGLGPGNFTPLYAEYCNPAASVAQHSHMVYLEVWLEMGVLGLSGFLGMYLGTMRRGVQVSAKADPLLKNVMIACVSSLAGIAFVSAAEYIWFYPRVMFAFFILLGILLSALKLVRDSE